MAHYTAKLSMLLESTLRLSFLAVVHDAGERYDFKIFPRCHAVIEGCRTHSASVAIYIPHGAAEMTLNPVNRGEAPDAALTGS